LAGRNVRFPARFFLFRLASLACLFALRHKPYLSATPKCLCKLNAQGKNNLTSPIVINSAVKAEDFLWSSIMQTIGQFHFVGNKLSRRM
jgi:hypothetical protein